MYRKKVYLLFFHDLNLWFPRTRMQDCDSVGEKQQLNTLKTLTEMTQSAIGSQAAYMLTKTERLVHLAFRGNEYELRSFNSNPHCALAYTSVILLVAPAPTCQQCVTAQHVICNGMPGVEELSTLANLVQAMPRYRVLLDYPKCRAIFSFWICPSGYFISPKAILQAFKNILSTQLPLILSWGKHLK